MKVQQSLTEKSSLARLAQCFKVKSLYKYCHGWLKMLGCTWSTPRLIAGSNFVWSEKYKTSPKRVNCIDFPTSRKVNTIETVQLQLRRVILQLASLEALTGIGYRMITSIDLLLGEHCPQSLYWCIGLQQERLLEVRECQHQCCETLPLKLLERCEGVWWQTKRVRLKLAVLSLK